LERNCQRVEVPCGQLEGAVSLEQCSAVRSGAGAHLKYLAAQLGVAEGHGSTTRPVKLPHGALRQNARSTLDIAGITHLHKHVGGEVEELFALPAASGSFLG